MVYDITVSGQSAKSFTYECKGCKSISKQILINLQNILGVYAFYKTSN